MIDLERQAGSATCIAHLSGDLDGFSAPMVREALDAAISQGCTSIILDLSAVTYLDSSALGLIVWADRRLHPLSGSLVLAGASREVARIVELSGLIGVAPSVFVATSMVDAISAIDPPVALGAPLWVRSFVVHADPHNMAGARSLIATALDPLSMPDSSIFDIKVASGEALANAVRHGSPRGTSDEIRVEVIAYEDRVEILVSDSGCGFDGHAEVPDDVYSAGGRGVLFMRALVDSVEFAECAGGGTSVRLIKRRAIPCMGAVG